MSGWLTAPVELHSSRDFDCMDFTDEQCQYYRYRWRFWYQADHVFALPTIAFFMCAIGLFIIGNIITQALAYRRGRSPTTWRRVIAATRYLSYRGFHVKSLRWNSAPIGLLLLAAIGATFFLCMDLAPQPYYWTSIDWGSSPPLATRSGWMALACMPFIFATASKTNWITLVTGISHEKLQIVHRWIAYAFFVLALMHTFPFIVYSIRFHVMVEQVTESSTIFYWTGIVALVFQAWLTFASFAPIRNLGYEFFKATHFLAVAIFVLIFFWHCDYTLSSWDYFIATAAVYVPCLVYSWIRTLFEYGSRQRAQIFVEENGFTRITIPARFDWVPGQHCFLRFRGFGIHALTSHPFTICSLPSSSPHEQSTMTFYIRHRGGLTARLYNYAMKQPGVSVPVSVDGPYGGIDPQKFYNSDRLIVIAGGSGAGWILPFIEQFARCSSFHSKHEPAHDAKFSQEEFLGDDEHSTRHAVSRPRTLRVILASREIETHSWFHKTVAELLSRYPSSDRTLELDVQVYTTGEAALHPRPIKAFDQLAASDSSISAEEVGTESDGSRSEKFGPSETTSVVQRGRPPLPLIIHEEAARVAELDQSLGVFVCGPVTMQNDVRNAVAQENLSILKAPRSSGIYLHQEHFSWA